METTVYQQFADLEENHFWFRGRRQIFFELIEQDLAGKRDLEILEIGCGAGGMLGPLSTYGQVTGLDISQDYIAFCRSRGYARVLTASGYELPFQDQSFDLVAMFDVIEHIPDPAAAFREMARVLKDDGIVIVGYPLEHALMRAFERLCRAEKWLFRYKGRSAKGKKFRPHVSDYHRIEESLDGALQTDAVRDVRLLGIPLYRLLRLKR